MGWETLANIGLGATTTHTLLFESFNLSQGSSFSRSFCSFYFIFVVLSMLAYISFFPPFLSFSLFFPFPRTLNFFLIRFLFYFVLLLTVSFSLTASFTCLFCTRGLFLLSCSHVSFSAGFFFLAPLYPFLFLLFYFFFFFYAFPQRLFLLPLRESLCLNWISLFFIHALFI